VTREDLLHVTKKLRMVSERKDNRNRDSHDVFSFVEKEKRKVLKLNLKKKPPLKTPAKEHPPPTHHSLSLSLVRPQWAQTPFLFCYWRLLVLSVIVSVIVSDIVSVIVFVCKDARV
jgi:hypothetical protein